MPLRTFRGHSPSVHASCFIESSAQIVGDVQIGEASSVWFNTVIRGDVNPVRIGRRTNIQDLSLIHVLSDRHGTTVGDDVTVGHQVVLHGCRVGNRVLVGMGTIILDGAEVGDDCIIAAGSLVTPGTVIPPRSLVIGRPAAVKRPLTPAEVSTLITSAMNYVGFAREYR